MLDHCNLLVEHLKEGKSSAIDAALDPNLLQLNSGDLSFSNPIRIQGVSYLAEDHLVIQLDVQSTAYLPCSVCNKSVSISVVLKNVYITKPLSELSSGKLNFAEDLREVVLLEVPSFAECNEGKCPERVYIEKYLKQSAVKMANETEEMYYPFDGLDEQMKKK
jgi:uncharacterized metal-binding protein YceD (DUF177 family)